MSLFLEKQCHFVVTFVYAMNKPHQREVLWQELENLSKIISESWCVLGDFNCIIDLSEVSGGLEHWTPDMQNFKNCVVNCGLDHLRTTCDLFTWCNNRPKEAIYKRLDRILVNSRWLHVFNDSGGFVKQRGIMDHCPLVVHTPMQLDKVHKPFQYFKFMSTLPSFYATVEKAWNTSWYGDPMAVLNRKLKDVKQALIQLNKDNGNVHSNVTQSKANLFLIQDRLRQDPHNPALLDQQKSLALALENHLLQEEVLDLQKSRVTWLAQGDGNNSFFHSQVRANWNSNKILAIKEKNGNMVSGHTQCSRVAVEFFQSTIGTC